MHEWNSEPKINQKVIRPFTAQFEIIYGCIMTEVMQTENIPRPIL